ncbi:hypothetical protein ACFCW6_34285 [Streptomyces sp. NPDC056333]|uniref:AMP-binding enzyme n=1 Tax=Streptomyces sp. NPDC056333 TaxID=3345786 RepID=UPI0035DE82A0
MARPLHDTDGWFYIVDRAKGLIIGGGFNVYPREIEEVLLTHPAVSMAAVIGVPHERHGGEIKACIVLTPGAALTEDELIAWCKEVMAGYKYPRRVAFLDVLPTNATGRILERELRGRPRPPRRCRSAAKIERHWRFCQVMNDRGRDVPLWSTLRHDSGRGCFPPVAPVFTKGLGAQARTNGSRPSACPAPAGGRGAILPGLAPASPLLRGLAGRGWR